MDSCERGISLAGGERAIAVSDPSGKAGTSGEIIGRARGLRALSAVGPTSETDGVPTCGFVNNASAAWRACLIRSRSSPRGYDCRFRPNKISPRDVFSFARWQSTQHSRLNSRRTLILRGKHRLYSIEYIASRFC